MKFSSSKVKGLWLNLANIAKQTMHNIFMCHGIFILKKTPPWLFERVLLHRLRHANYVIRSALQVVSEIQPHLKLTKCCWRTLNKADLKEDVDYWHVSPPPAALWRRWPAVRWERCTPECFPPASGSHSCGWKQSEPDTSSPPGPFGPPVVRNDSEGWTEDSEERQWRSTFATGWDRVIF